MQDNSEENNFMNPMETKSQKTNKNNSTFKQQLLTAWKPKPTLACAIIFYITIGIIFIIIGSIVITFSKKINDINLRYDTISSCKIGEKCQIEIELKNTFKAPVFFYYHISDFYQNNRIYVKSIVSKQLRGNAITSSEADSCSEAKYNKDFVYVNKNVNGGNLIPNEIAHPCGLAARAYFNDTFTLKHKKTDLNIPILDKGIAWKDDIKDKFKNYDLNKQWINVESERFMNWMKISPFPQFQKTWGRIEQDLQEGLYVVEIDNRWDVLKFSGKKRFGLSDSNVFGSQNFFLGWAYVSIGCLSFLFALGFGIRKIQRPKGVLEKRLKEVNTQEEIN